MPELKQHLHHLCSEFIASREAEIKTAIAEMQEAAANETKSSAGDKYETTREMLAQETNMNLSRLNELHRLRAALSQVPVSPPAGKVVVGSLVHTSSGSYYISISAGKLVFEDRTYYCISASSPIGQKILGKQAGDSFDLNGKTIIIDRLL